METISMSYEELDRVSVIERVIEKRLTQREAARMLGLTAKGQIDEDALDAIQRIEETLDWHNGARVVARAWTDPAYRARLLADGTSACAELGFARLSWEARASRRAAGKARSRRCSWLQQGFATPPAVMHRRTGVATSLGSGS
jgi:hypothetical protein